MLAAIPRRRPEWVPAPITKRASEAVGLMHRPAAIPVTASIQQAIATFREHPSARFLGVVDERGRPLGAIHERVLRDLLFSPFGHALLANPGCRWTLGGFIRPCGNADEGGPLEMLIAAYGEHLGAEGLILTRDGRYSGLIDGPSLLQLAAANQREAAEKAMTRARSIEASVARFRSEAVEFADMLGEAATVINETSQGVADRASRNGAQALTVATAARESSEHIAEAADSSGDLAVQGRAIELRVDEAMGAFAQASLHVEQGADKARTLSVAADEIGSVVGLIAAIASKVNILAINATIEAARAGPAGRSFAVVAGEVKSLAGQAADAARQIEAQIFTVRNAVGQTVDGNQAVESVVRKLGTICGDISRSVGRQTAAASQIAANVEQAALRSASVSENIGEIGERASTAGTMAVRLTQVAEALRDRAGKVRDRVEGFLVELDAA